MRWIPGTSDSDIEDRRGSAFGRVPGGGRGLGLGGIIIVGILSLVFRQNFFSLFDGSGGSAPVDGPSAPPSDQTPEEKQRYEFVKFVINDVQDTWAKVLPASANVQYQHAKLCCFVKRSSRDAALRNPRPVRSTARTIRRCISISVFTMS